MSAPTTYRRRQPPAPTPDPCFICGGPQTGMHPHTNDCPWQTGKLDVECAKCGLQEAASVRCSGPDPTDPSRACGHVHEPSEYRVHSNPGACHYQSADRRRGRLPSAIRPATPATGSETQS